MRMATQKETSALVLTAGGARGAYQAGVMKRIAEIKTLVDKPAPFQIITGASAGAINGVTLASQAMNFTEGARRLSDLWSGLKSRQVFKPDLGSLSKLAGIWLRDLSVGGLIGGGHAQSLLDAAPLHELIANSIDYGGIERAIKAGVLHAAAISATNYYSGVSTTFIQGAKGHATWTKSRRIGYATEIKAEHVCASSAIPIIFQPIPVDTPYGHFFFGDGALRLVNPLSPAIRLGAEKILAVGIRSQKAAMERLEDETHAQGRELPQMKKPPLAQVMGVTFNAIFLDHLDSDVDHLVRMNELLRVIGSQVETKVSEMKEPIRIVKPLIVSPSVDLAQIAEHFADKMPAVVRYFLEGLGASRAESSDLMSYLLFDSSYTQELIRIGYEDADHRAAEIEDFLVNSQ